jgi:outer membrane protein assembly factor BamB
MMQRLERDDPRSIGVFRLRARLGAGGMGRVYLGYSPAGRAVAVKVCHPELAEDPAFVARFAREVAAARAVNGLYTAQVIDAGPDDRPPWLATSYVPGPSLHDAVAGNGAVAGRGPLPELAVWRLAAGLAEALQAVHARGLVHRDLKPTNVLLAADGPRVIDFGIARALDGTALTATGYALGTPAYMSPEQASGQPATPASDVFAFGSVLCFAATADSPFGDGEPPAVLYRIVHAEPALAALHGALRDLIAGCLAKDPADRPTLAQVLRTGQTQTPRPGGPSASFWPGQVATLIAEYQAGPGDAGLALVQKSEPALEPGEAPTLGPGEEPTLGLGGEPALGPVLVPGEEPTQTDRAGIALLDRSTPPGPGGAPRRDRQDGPGGDLVAPDRSASPGVGGGDRQDQQDRVAGPISRRRTLIGLAAAGLAAGGLAAGGWAYARSGSGSGSGSGRRSAGPSRLLWARKTGGPVSSGAALYDGIVYIGSGDGLVHSFAAASGHPAGTFRTSGAVNGGVTVAGGTLFAGSADKKVHAFRVGTGGAAWTYPTSGEISCTPAVADGLVCIGSDDHNVYCLHADTGRLAWSHPTGGAVRSGPVPVFQSLIERFYVGSNDGYVYALGSDGTLWWRFAAGAPVTAGPTYDAGIVYVGDSAGNVFGLFNIGRSPQWEKNVGGAVGGVAAAADSYLFVGSADSAVYARNLISGDQDWRYPTSGPVNSGLATDGTTLYAGDDHGYVYAIDIASVSPLWSYKVGAAVQSQILLANGVVYFGSQDHYVYALRA